MMCENYIICAFTESIIAGTKMVRVSGVAQMQQVTHQNMANHVVLFADTAGD